MWMLLLWIIFVIYVSCLSCFLFCSMQPCGHPWERAILLTLLCVVFCCLFVTPVWCGTWLYRFLIFCWPKSQNTLKNDQYDQEIPQSQTADKPMASWGRATQLSRYTRRTRKTTQPSLSLPHLDFWMIVLLLIIPKSFPYVKQLLNINQNIIFT